MARRSERGYIVRAGGALIAFVPHPEIPTWWFRLHPCVLMVSCSVCKSKISEPCRSRTNWLSDTHWQRRSESVDKVQKTEKALGLVFDIQLRLAMRRNP